MPPAPRPAEHWLMSLGATLRTRAGLEISARLTQSFCGLSSAIFKHFGRPDITTRLISAGETAGLLSTFFELSIGPKLWTLGSVLRLLKDTKKGLQFISAASFAIHWVCEILTFRKQIGSWRSNEIVTKSAHSMWALLIFRACNLGLSLLRIRTLAGEADKYKLPKWWLTFGVVYDASHVARACHDTKWPKVLQSYDTCFACLAILHGFSELKSEVDRRRAAL
eukprot:NODE_8020_length_1530_cov_3.933713.p1 GENE.NODE_8020_length_1530_cov_3.933713~~NODE_8020_length_1530_cov_3.933713.p1  ORF type:complete len:250 (-),score=16.69 NODE_8020_length_1530_cov_3.933713:780-1448(-)